jgi:hypothetical protein
MKTATTWFSYFDWDYPPLKTDVIYLNNRGDKWKPVEKQKVKINNLFTKTGQPTEIKKPIRVVQCYQQSGNYCLAKFADGTYSTDFEVTQ